MIPRRLYVPALALTLTVQGSPKASMEPLTIHQYVWYEDEARTRPLMISCKMKSADHLNEALGAGRASSGRPGFSPLRRPESGPPWPQRPY